jgi:dTDP-4-amino-4,6-dideoxygalactose transaminase
MIAARYLVSIKGGEVVLPFCLHGATHVWHLFVVRTSCRDAVQAQLSEAGIETLIHYPVPPHRSEAYRNEYVSSRYPIAEELAESVLSLPLNPYLSGNAQDMVVKQLREIVD